MGEPPSDAASPAADAALVRELALRLLGSRFGTSSAGEAPTDLLIGRLPPDFPYQLPAPEGARLLGTLLCDGLVIVVDAPLSAEAALAFYTERLTALGWTDELRWRGRQGGGFAHRPIRARTMTNFLSPDGLFRFSVETMPAPDGQSTTILLALYPALRSVSPHERARNGFIFGVLPTLQPPVGSAQFSEGGSGGPDLVRTSAWVEGDFPLSALRAHYTEALLHAGWTLVDGGEQGPAAWCRWTFRDEDGSRWSALLLIVECAELPHRFDLTWKAHRVSES
jgi:hypothetical protein